MIPFPQAAIDFARTLNEANLPDTCTVSVPGEWIPDNEGGGTFGPGTTYSFPCRTWPLSSKEMEALVAEQIREPGLEGLAMPFGQPLPNDATVTVTKGETGEAVRYDVRGRVPDPTFAMMSRAIIRRAHPEGDPEEPEEPGNGNGEQEL